MKIIKIGSCEMCPHYEEDWYQDNMGDTVFRSCFISNGTQILAKEKGSFPSWCPLQDYKEVKE